MIENEQ